MRSPARTATKSPRPSSPRPQQQQPPPPPWRLWFVGLLCAFALVVVIERGGGAALDADPILNEPIEITQRLFAVTENTHTGAA